MQVFRRIGLVGAVLATAWPAAADPARGGASIEDLAALVELGGPYAELAVAPDGARAALIERRMLGDDYRYAVVAIDVRTGAAREIGEAGGFVLRSDGGRHAGIAMLRRPQFSADGASVFYLRGAEGRIEIWRAPVDSAGAEALVRADGDIRGFRVTGDRIVYEVSTPRDELATDAAQRQRSGFAVDERFTPSYALTPMPETDRNVRTYVYDLAHGQTSDASESDRALLDSNSRPHIRTLDPAIEVDEPAIGLFDNVTGAQCGDPACAGAITDTWNINASDGSRAILFRRLEGHARRITAFYLWRVDGGAVRLITRSETRIEGCAPALDALVCLQDAAFQPRRVIAIALRDGRERTLYDPNPQWRAIARPRIERFDYTDREGNQSFAHLVYPLGWRRGQTYPLILVQYRSRGFLLGGVGDETPIYPLSANGYFVLSFDRPEFRARSQRMNYAALQREVELDGIERGAKRQAIDFFIRRALARGADRQRLAITGLSDGAETVYAMLMDEPSLFAAAIVSTPPTDPISWPLQSEAFRASSARRLGLTGPWDDAPEPWRSWWRHNSPVFHSDRLRAPILFNLAEAEAIRAFPLITRLRERGLPHDAYIYPGAYHLKWRPTHIRAVQQRTLDWLDFWLRGVERPDESDPGRLDRWRRLRSAQDQ